MLIADITSLAALKRHLRPGVRFRCINAAHPEVSGSRTATKAQGNGFRFDAKFDDGREIHNGFTEYPKAHLLAFNGDRVGFLDAPGGRPVFTYIFGEAE
jgi:hypothetical protein